jgi:hypothetical protein
MPNRRLSLGFGTLLSIPSQKSRLGFADIRGHAFFKNLDWSTLRSGRAPFRPELTSNLDTVNNLTRPTSTCASPASG